MAEFLNFSEQKARQGTHALRIGSALRELLSPSMRGCGIMAQIFHEGAKATHAIRPEPPLSSPENSRISRLAARGRCRTVLSTMMEAATVLLRVQARLSIDDVKDVPLI